jgi:heat-inducible transcriptional repressor
MLDERKMRILSAIIDDYIATAEPIGSRTIARKYNIGISPATIRNEMADLEELGYLSQPHTSAGRVPSNKGYRFYVDYLLPQKKLKLNSAEYSLIQKAFEKRVLELEDLIQEAGRVISQLTSYTSIILGPQLETSRLKHIQIIRLEEGKGLIIMVTNYGTISHNIVEIPHSFTDSDLIRISNLLNTKLTGMALSEITPEVIESISQELIEYDGIINVLIDILLENLDDAKDNTKVVATGSSKMLGFPEFRDVDRAKIFLSLIEENDLIYQTLKKICKPNAITVTIGTENPYSELQDYSIVTTSLSIDDKNLGIWGILGPTRMEYSKVIATLEKVTDYLTTVLFSQF